MGNAAVETASRRKVWLDVLRGLPLVLVIYGHQVGGWYGYFLLTGPVKIPLFFAITGYLFNEDKSLRDFLTTLFWRLLVPWVAIGLLTGACHIVFLGDTTVRGVLMAYVRGKAAWYVPCCVVAEILWYAIRRAFRSVPATAVAAAACFAASMLLTRRRMLNNWMVNRAMAAQVFLLVGLVYRRWLEKLPRRALWGFAALAAYLALALLSTRLYPGSTLDAHRNRYYSIPLCMGMVASGCLALFWLFQSFAGSAPDWLGWFGRNTLVVYLLHNASTRLPRKMLSLAGFHRSGLAQAALLLAAAVLLACAVYSLIAALIGRFAPVLAGRWRPGKKNAGAQASDASCFGAEK